MKWKKRDEKALFDSGYRKLIQKEFELPDGSIAKYDIKAEENSVCILAISKDNLVILAKQYRPGREEVYLELPGGGIKTDQTPLEAAKAELAEETGYTGEMEKVTVIPNCAYSTAEKHIFIARNCKKTTTQNLDPQEFIEVVEMPLEEFRKDVIKGNRTDTATAYLGLDYLNLL